MKKVQEQKKHLRVSRQSDQARYAIERFSPKVRVGPERDRQAQAANTTHGLGHEEQRSRFNENQNRFTIGLK